MEKTHLINENGERKVVETRRAEEEIKRLNKSTNTTYHIDIDWYLANGYVEISKARRNALFFSIFLIGLLLS